VPIAPVHKPREQFNARVAAVGPQHFGIVAVDCAKARSKWMLTDFFGNVLVPPTFVEHQQNAFRAMHACLQEAIKRHQLSDLLVAIERTGTYHRPVQEFFRQSRFDVRLVHAFASSQHRQPADPGNKTDDTDLAGIFRAAVNGFGLVDPPWPEDYLHLQVLVRQLTAPNADAENVLNVQPTDLFPQQGLKFAVIVLATLPILLVYPFLQKHFAKGVLIGSVKE